MSSDFQGGLKARQTLIDASLKRLLTEACGDSPASVREALAYSLMAPGKRLRPIMVLMACEAADGGDDEALPAACALEMVHTYSLIHDDLPAMDDDDLRRGLPTCHKKFGEALAILAGDALLTLAFQVLAESYPPATAAVSCAELARGAGAAGMVGGQALDLAAEGKISNGQRPTTLDDLESIHRRKTGALFRSSLRLGLYAAQGERNGGPDPDLQRRFDVFGRAFGLAFQISDDLLDVEGSSENTGKRVSKDAARGSSLIPDCSGLPKAASVLSGCVGKRSRPWKALVRQATRWQRLPAM